MRVFEWTKTAVDQVYQSHQKSLMEVVRSAYEVVQGVSKYLRLLLIVVIQGDEGLAVAADITESTRRRSMPVDFAVLSDCRTKLILHTESIVRQECGRRLVHSRAYWVHPLYLLKWQFSSSDSKLRCSSTVGTFMWLCAIFLIIFACFLDVIEELECGPLLLP